MPHHDYDALATDTKASSWLVEMRVVMVVLAFVLTLELIARVVAPILDFDRENIFAFPEVIENLEKAAEESGNPKVVFFGNSLMLHGLDQELTKQKIAKDHGSDIETAKVTPVGTAMLDWVYLYRRYFSDQDSHPDILIVGFVAHHIHDQEAIKLRRLSRHFVTKKDLPLLWETDLEKDFHNITQSILCNISALGGDQPEHQLGILQTLIADYKAGLNRNNDLVAEWKQRLAEEAAERESKENTATQKETYQRMLRFIRECKKHGVKMYFVPMPQPEVWDFNPDAQKIIEAEVMTVLDARRIPGMTEQDFSDGYHLGETGKAKFTKWLADKLGKELK